MVTPLDNDAHNIIAEILTKSELEEGRNSEEGISPDRMTGTANMMDLQFLLRQLRTDKDAAEKYYAVRSDFKVDMGYHIGQDHLDYAWEIMNEVVTCTTLILDLYGLYRFIYNAIKDMISEIGSWSKCFLMEQEARARLGVGKRPIVGFITQEAVTHHMVQRKRHGRKWDQRYGYLACPHCSSLNVLDAERLGVTHLPLNPDGTANFPSALCGYCHKDLTEAESPHFDCHLSPVPRYVSGTVGSKIEQSLLLNRLGLSPPEAADAILDVAESHDGRIVTSQMSRLNLGSCEIPPNLTSEFRVSLNSEFPDIEFVVRTSMWSASPETTAAINASMTQITKNVIGHEVYWPTIDQQPVTNRVRCHHPAKDCGSTDCDHWCGRSPVITMETLALGAEAVTTIISRTEMASYVILPEAGYSPKTETGKYSGTNDHYMNRGGMVHYLKAGMNSPYSIHGSTFKSLLYSDVINIHKKQYRIRTVLQVAHMVVREVMQMDRTAELITPHKPTSELKVREFTIPELNRGALLELTGAEIVTRKKVRVEASLLHALMVRNITGTLSGTELLDYAMAFAFTRYNIDKRVISYQHLTREQVQDHACIALMLTRRARWKVEGSVNMLRLTGADALKNKLFTSLGHMLIFSAQEVITSTKAGNLIDRAAQIANKLALGSIDMVGEDPVWDELDKWCAKVEMGKVSIADVGPEHGSKPAEPGAEEPGSCPHTWATEPIGSENCECCGRRCTGQHCKDCMVVENDSHYCMHECNQNHTGDTICLCCRLPSQTRLCRCCTIECEAIPMFEPPPKETDGDEMREGVSGPARRVAKSWPYVKKDKDTQSNADRTVSHGKTKQLKKGSAKKFDDPEVVITVDNKRDFPELVAKPDQTDQTILKAGEVETPIQLPAPDQGQPPTTKPSYSDKLQGARPMKTHNDDEEEEEEVTETSLKNRAIIEISEEFLQAITHLDSWPGGTGVLAMSGEKPFTSHCPYLLRGTTTTGPGYFNPNSTGVILNSIGTCGLDALKVVWDMNLPVAEMEAMTGSTIGWAADELITVAKKRRKNLLIITANETRIHKAESGWDMPTIIHSSAIKDDTTNHWYPGSAQMIKLPTEMIGCNDVAETAVYDSLTRQVTGGQQQTYCPSLMTISERILVNLGAKTVGDELIEGNENMMNFKMVEIDGKEWLTNNQEREHNVMMGKIHVEVKAMYKQIVSCMCVGSSGVLANDCLRPRYDRDPGLPHDMTNYLVAELADTVRTILEVKWFHHTSNPNSKIKLTQEMCSCEPTPTGALVTFNNPGMKTFDMISIRTKSTQAMVPVKVIQGKAAVPVSLTEKKRNMQIGHLRLSIGSMVRKLVAILGTGPNMSLTRKLLTEAKLTLGPPGSGKSTELAKTVGNHDLVVAGTTGAINSIKQKGVRNYQLMSLERAKYEGSTYQVDCLFIDECTTVGVVDAHILLNKIKPQRVHGFGDVAQIGYKDMMITGGERYEEGMHRFMGNTTELNTTYRIGQPLAEELAKVMPGLTSLANHPTELVLKHQNVYSRDMVIQAGCSENVDTILVFYKKHLNDLAKTLKTISGGSTDMALWARRVRTSTVHAYQGQEADRVMVIQQRLTAQPGIETEEEYCLSAATRAKEKLVWLSVGAFNPSTPLAERIRVGPKQAGYGLLASLESRIRAKVTIPVEEPEEEDMIIVMQTLADTSIKLLRNNIKRDYGMSFNAIIKDGKTTVTIQKWKLTVIVLEITADGAIKIIKDSIDKAGELTKMIRLMLEPLEMTQSRCTTCNQLDLHTSKCPQTPYGPAIVENIVRMGKLFGDLGQQLKLTISGVEYTFESTGSCDQCRRVVMHAGKDLIGEFVGQSLTMVAPKFRLQGDDQGLGLTWKRVINRGPSTEIEHDLLESLVTMGVTGNTNYVATILEKTHGLMQAGKIMVKKAFEDFFETPTGTTANPVRNWCLANGLNYKSHVTTRGQHIALATQAGVTVVCHTQTNTIVAVGDNMMGSDANMFDLVRRVLKHSALNVAHNFIARLLETKKIAGRGGELEFTGMLVGTDIHQKRGTKVWRNLLQKHVKNTVANLRGEEDKVYLTREEVSRMGPLIQKFMGDIPVGIHSHMIPIDDGGNAAEQLVSYVIYRNPSTTPDFTVTNRPHCVSFNSHVNTQIVRPTWSSNTDMDWTANLNIHKQCCQLLSECINTIREEETDCSNDNKLPEPEITTKKSELASRCLQNKPGKWTPFEGKMSGTVLLNHYWMTASDRDLIDLIKSHEGVRFICTCPMMSLEKYDEVETAKGEMMVILDKRTGAGYYCTKKNVERLRNGWKLEDGEGNGWVFKTLYTVLTCEVMEITKLSRPGPNLGYFSPVRMEDGLGLTHVEVPRITTDPLTLIRTGQHLETIHLLVDTRLLQSMMKRTLRQATFDEVLQFARVHANGMLFSMKGFKAQSTDTPHDIQWLAGAVYVAGTQQLEKFERVLEILEVKEAQYGLDAIERLKSRVRMVGGGIKAELTALVGGDASIEDIATYLLDNNIKSMQPLRELVRCWKAMNVNFGNSLRRMYPRPDNRKRPIELTPGKINSTLASRLRELVCQNVKVFVQSALRQVTGRSNRIRERNYKRRGTERLTDDPNVRSGEVYDPTLLYRDFKSIISDKVCALREYLLEIENSWDRRILQATDNERITVAEILQCIQVDMVEMGTSIGEQNQWCKIIDQHKLVQGHFTNEDVWKSQVVKDGLSKLLAHARLRRSGKGSPTILVHAVGSTGDYKFSASICHILSKSGAIVDAFVPADGAYHYEGMGVRKIHTTHYDTRAKMESWNKLQELNMEEAMAQLEQGAEPLRIDHFPQEVLDGPYDLVIGAITAVYAQHIAEKLGAAYVECNAMPEFVRDARDTWWKSTGVGQAVSSALNANIFIANNPGIHEFRLNQNLPEIDSTEWGLCPRPNVFCYEPCISTGPVSGNWPVIGYLGRELIVKQTEQEEIQVDYLFTMGSMVHRNIVGFAKEFVSQVGKRECRALILGGYFSTEIKQALGEIMENFVPDVELQHGLGKLIYKDCYSHDKVMHEGTIVIHHGGSGTTNQSFVSGCGQIVISVAFDQDYWGKRVMENHIGVQIKVQDEPAALTAAMNWGGWGKTFQVLRQMKRFITRNVATNLIRAIKMVVDETHPDSKLVHDGLLNTLTPVKDDQIFTRPAEAYKPTALTRQQVMYTSVDHECTKLENYDKLKKWAAIVMQFEGVRPVPIRRLWHSCCNNHDSDDFVFAETDTVYITYYKDQQMKEWVNYTTKEHQISQPVLPFKTNRGPPGTATLPFHAHGQVREPGLPEEKRLEVVTLAGHQQIIDEDRWREIASKNARGPSKDRRGKGTSREVMCQVCNQRRWEGMADTLVCTLCVAKAEFHQEGMAELSTAQLTTYNAIMLGEERPLLNYLMGIGISCDRREDNKHLEPGKYTVTPGRIRVLYDPQKETGCVRDCITAYASGSSASRKVWSSGKPVQVKGSAEAAMRDTLMRLKLPYLVDRGNLTDYISTIGLSHTIVQGERAIVNVIKDSWGHIELQIVEGPSSLHAQLVSLESSIYENAQASPMVTMPTRKVVDINQVECPRCKQLVWDSCSKHAPLWETDCRNNLTHKNPQTLWESMKAVMSRDQTNVTRSWGEHWKGIFERLNLRKFHHVLDEMTEPIMPCQVWRTENAYACTEAVRLTHGAIVMVPTYGGPVAAVVMQGIGCWHLISSKNPWQPTGGLLLMRSNAFPTEREQRPVTHSKTLCIYNQLSKTHLDEESETWHPVAVDHTAKRVVLYSLDVRDHHSGSVRDAINKVKDRLVKPDFTLWSAEEIEKISNYDTLGYTLLKGQLTPRVNLFVTSDISAHAKETLEYWWDRFNKEGHPRKIATAQRAGHVITVKMGNERGIVPGHPLQNWYKKFQPLKSVMDTLKMYQSEAIKEFRGREGQTYDIISMTDNVAIVAMMECINSDTSEILGIYSSRIGLHVIMITRSEEDRIMLVEIFKKIRMVSYAEECLRKFWEQQDKRLEDQPRDEDDASEVNPEAGDSSRSKKSDDIQIVELEDTEEEVTTSSGITPDPTVQLSETEAGDPLPATTKQIKITEITDDIDIETEGTPSQYEPAQVSAISKAGADNSTPTTSGADTTTATPAGQTPETEEVIIALGTQGHAMTQVELGATAESKDTVEDTQTASASTEMETGKDTSESDAEFFDAVEDSPVPQTTPQQDQAKVVEEMEELEKNRQQPKTKPMATVVTRDTVPITNVTAKTLTTQPRTRKPKRTATTEAGGADRLLLYKKCHKTHRYETDGQTHQPRPGKTGPILITGPELSWLEIVELGHKNRKKNLPIATTSNLMSILEPTLIHGPMEKFRIEGGKKVLEVMDGPEEELLAANQNLLDRYIPGNTARLGLLYRWLGCDDKGKYHNNMTAGVCGTREVCNPEELTEWLFKEDTARGEYIWNMFALGPQARATIQATRPVLHELSRPSNFPDLGTGRVIKHGQFLVDGTYVLKMRVVNTTGGQLFGHDITVQEKPDQYRHSWREPGERGKYKLGETKEVEIAGDLMKSGRTTKLSIRRFDNVRDEGAATDPPWEEMASVILKNQKVVLTSARQYNRYKALQEMAEEMDHQGPWTVELAPSKLIDLPKLDEVHGMVSCTLDWVYSDAQTEEIGEVECQSFLPYIEPVETDTGALVGDNSAYENVFSTIFFEDNDLLDFIMKVAPSQGLIKVSKIPSKIVKTTKTTMTKRPLEARPVFTKLSGAEFNAVSRRLCSVIQLRKFELYPESEFSRLKSAYFRDDCDTLLRGMQANPINYNSDEIRTWLAARPDGLQVAAELEAIMAEGFEVNPINRAKVHVKLESLLKDGYDSVGNREVEARIIVWQRKGFCAIFSPIFLQAKSRLKSLLNDKTLYADGLTAGELSARARLLPGGLWMMEDDLSKQDRQTDRNLIECEMECYKQLGVDERVLRFWERTHQNWKFKGSSVSGILDAQRLTGQATTALGNALVNMMVHSRLVEENKRHVRLVCILGDDNLILSEHKISSWRQVKDSKDYYNMVSKASHSKEVGTFLQQVCYTNSVGTMEFAPDMVRLSRRFEVTNGVSEANDANMLARTMSYCSLMGKTKGTERVIKTLGLPIRPTHTCDIAAARQAVATKRNMTIHEVEGAEHHLYEMMENQRVYHWEFLHYMDD